VPDRGEIDFFVDHSYAVRTEPAARAAYLATLRDVRVDFERTRRTIAARRHARSAGAADPRRQTGSSGRSTARRSPKHSSAEGPLVDECGHFPQIEQVEW